MLRNRSMRRTLRLGRVFPLLLFYILWVEGTGGAEQQTARDIISKIEQNYLRIENYQVDVSRIYYRGEVPEAREEWRFTFRTPALAKIEIALPKKVILVVTDDTVWQYFIEDKKVMKKTLQGLKEKEKIVLVAQLLKPYEIEGWGLSISSEFGDRLQVVREEMVSGRTCSLIECKPHTDSPQRFKLLLWIDQERLAVVRRELYGENGQFVSRTDNENFLEVLPGIWLPRKVETTIPTEKGKVMRQLVLRNIKMNESLSEGTFQFNPPEGSEVIIFNERGELVKNH